METLRLVSVLNSLWLDEVSAPTAEERLRYRGQPHHVYDPNDLLGIDPIGVFPIRLALAKIAQHQKTSWLLLTPRPGRTAGLRGPDEINREALDAGAVAIPQTGQLAFVAKPVGEAMQWLVLPANQPVAPPSTSEAHRALSTSILESEKLLTQLDSPAGTRPDSALSVNLANCYAPKNQKLLDRAMIMLTAAEAGLAGSVDLLTSFSVLQRENILRNLAHTALDAVSSAASWPQG